MVNILKKKVKSKTNGLTYSYENTSANMSFPGKSYYPYTAWRQQAKSEVINKCVDNAELEDSITDFFFLPTCQQKAINVLFHNCKTFSHTFILLYPETQEVSTALS